MIRTAVFLAISLSSPALAQSLEIEPLTFDADGPETLVVAALDTTGTPRIAGLSGARPAATLVSLGRPAPSLILGVIEPGQEAAFGVERLLSSTVAEIAFDLDDLAAREALRDRDPELFRRLVSEGHVDPPADGLNRRLQIELARSNCYRSGIDGIWGPGSRGSVGEYFAELDGVSADSQEPSMGLFRTILVNGDVTCTAPVRPAPSRAPTVTPPSPPRNTAARPPQPVAPAPPPAPAPAPAPAR
ncbi:MAG: hypothetical protein ACU0CI_08885, partial [Shimia sp.]